MHHGQHRCKGDIGGEHIYKWQVNINTIIPLYTNIYSSYVLILLNNFTTWWYIDGTIHQDILVRKQTQCPWQSNESWDLIATIPRCEYIYIYIGSRWSGDWHSWGGSFWILLSLLILIHEKIYKNRASCFGSRSTPYFNLNVNDPCIKMLQIWRFQLPLGSSLPTSHAKRALIRCSENHWMVGPSLSFDHRSSPKVTF